MDVLSSILDNIDHSVIITDPYGALLFFNQEAAQTVATLHNSPLRIGEPLSSYVTSERKEIFQQIMTDIARDKKSVKTWAEFRQLNGLTMHLELNYTPIIDESENMSFVTVLGKDVTASRIFEKRIRAQAANVENLIQKANAIIFSTDSRSYITSWNDHCTRITGFEKNEVYTKKIGDVVLHESARETFNLIFNQLLTGESLSRYETKIETKEGKVLNCLLSGTPQLTTDGKTFGVVFVGQDITELSEYRRSLENKIEERTRELRRALQQEKDLVDMKTRFVAVASHEFRTPLSSIQFATNFLKYYNDRIDENERVKKLDNIIAQLDHMTSLLNDVLTYGKNDWGAADLKFSAVSLRPFIEKVAEEAALSRGNSHKVIISADDTLTEIETDEKLLRSIVANLLTNAMKFSPGRDAVYVFVRTFDTHLRIAVRDEGIGIPPDELDKVFEPFLRGRAAESIAGTGLGLSITKKAAELLGGNIKVESNVSNGTTFEVNIPLAQGISRFPRSKR
jgi:PAS domain S-box-containing protein